MHPVLFNWLAAAMLLAFVWAVWLQYQLSGSVVAPPDAVPVGDVVDGAGVPDDVRGEGSGAVGGADVGVAEAPSVVGGFVVAFVGVTEAVRDGVGVDEGFGFVEGLDVRVAVGFASGTCEGEAGFDFFALGDGVGVADDRGAGTCPPDGERLVDVAGAGAVDVADGDSFGVSSADGSMAAPAPTVTIPATRRRSTGEIFFGWECLPSCFTVDTLPSPVQYGTYVGRHPDQSVTEGL